MSTMIDVNFQPWAFWATHGDLCKFVAAQSIVRSYLRLTRRNNAAGDLQGMPLGILNGR
jgi:hypothetical protein